jgi:hypothetical protein
MTAMRWVSPRILIELLAIYDREMVAGFARLDPDAPGIAVAWAGETVSRNWFDIARMYTEKWHHQQQLRDATGRPPLYQSELLTPVLETFARGLPFAFRSRTAKDGTRVSVTVTGPVQLTGRFGGPVINGRCGAVRTRTPQRRSRYPRTSPGAYGPRG